MQRKTGYCNKDSANDTDAAKNVSMQLKSIAISRLPNYQHMLEEITKDDVTLCTMLDGYRELCKNDLVTGGPGRYHRALIGMSRNSLESVGGTSGHHWSNS